MDLYYLHFYDLYCGMKCVGRIKLNCSQKQFDTIRTTLFNAGIDMKSNINFDPIECEPWNEDLFVKSN